jgi:hypothetical protein
MNSLVSSEDNKKLLENKYGKFCPHCYSANTVHLPLGEANAVLLKYLSPGQAKSVLAGLEEYGSGLPDPNIYLCLEEGCHKVFKATKVFKAAMV